MTHKLTPLETLRALLCDHEGNVCIRGSDEDRRLIQEALAALYAVPEPPGMAEIERAIRLIVSASTVAERIAREHVHHNGIMNAMDCKTAALSLLSLIRAALAQPRVPDEMVLTDYRGGYGVNTKHGYQRGAEFIQATRDFEFGWNACRAAMLAAAPQPPTEKGS